MYVHVPFCAVRCGYCDFNTYTADELGGASGPPGSSRETYAAAAAREVGLARTRLGADLRPASTVFVGGGTPTLLPSQQLVKILHSIDRELGLTDDAEVTTEANPDSVTPQSLAVLREGGFTRISFGMQSAVRSVLEVLDRTHDPERLPRVVRWAREAGFEQVSLDLIYGTPGETREQWRTSLEAAMDCAPDHVSAYSLVVEPGTALARRVRRGEVAQVDDDDLADKYLLAEELLSGAGYEWYEVSNWARSDEARCRHNLGYWRGDDWWGVGPGAHSHVAGVRWWNVKHPAEYARRLARGESPEADREVLDGTQRHLEEVMLRLRLREGLPAALLLERETARVPALVQRGLLVAEVDGWSLTPTGRLLADGVVRELLD
jgi:putative oxygen-independent coproporphyrinogen III oxidase